MHKTFHIGNAKKLGSPVWFVVIRYNRRLPYLPHFEFGRDRLNITRGGFHFAAQRIL